MSIIQGTSMASAAGGYDVTNAIHFSAASSQYFLKTYGAAATDTKKFTFSTWIKKAKVNSATSYGLFSGGTGTSAGRCDFQFTAGAATGDTYYDQLKFEIYNGSWTFRVATPMLRDPSSFYHVVLIYDVANATAADTLIMYVNNVRQTLNSATAMPNNASLFMSNGAVSCIGADTSATRLGFDGVMSEIMAVDGQALDPTYFGEFDDNGVWRPIDVSGLTFGTNGFYITSADGVDQSGNGNDWTPVNTPTDTADTPTNITPIFNSNYNDGATISNGGESIAAGSGSSGLGCAITMAVDVGASDGWYGEIKCTANGGSAARIGIYPTGLPPANMLGGAGGYGYAGDGTKVIAAISSVAYGNSWTTNDVIGIAIKSGKIWFAKNGVWQNSGDPAAGTGEAFSGLSGVWHIFAGQASYTLKLKDADFDYTPPSGFVALNSANIYANDPPAIEDGSAHFQTTLYTGTGATLTVSQTGNSTFEPGLVWVKARSSAENHNIADVLRGASDILRSNTTSAADTQTQSINAFNADGFQVGSYSNVGTNGVTHVGWQWKMGGAPTTDNVAGTLAVPTAGSVKVDDANYGSALAGSLAVTRASVNTVAGFSIVKFTMGTAPATTYTIDHLLGVAPSFLVIKGSGVVNNWVAYHVEAGNTKYLQLNSAIAATTDANAWASTTPSSSLVSLNTTSWGTSGNVNIMYAFAETPGLSKFSKYTGNGSADGTFVYCGFKPAFLFIKSSSHATSWYLFDGERNPTNPAGKRLVADATATEDAGTTEAFDFLSNGFKLRNTSNGTNGSGRTYIYAAFAEVPSFGATPAKAR